MTSLLFMATGLVLLVAFSLSLLLGQNKSLSRLCAVAGISLIYLITAAILCFGHFNPTLQVSLEGLQYQLRERSGAPRVFRIGGDLQGARGSAADDIHVSGYPAGAFVLRAVGDHLELSPGPNYDGRCLVKINGRLVGRTPLDRNGARITQTGAHGGVKQVDFLQGPPFNSHVTLKAGNRNVIVPARKMSIPGLDLHFTSWSLFPEGSRVFYLPHLFEGHAGKPAVNTPRGILIFSDLIKGFHAAAFVPLAEGISVGGRQTWPYPLKIYNGDSITFYRLLSRGNSGQGPDTFNFLRTALEIQSIRLSNDSVDFFLTRPRLLSLPIAQIDQPKSSASGKKGKPRLAITSGVGATGDINVIHLARLPKVFNEAFTYVSLEDNSYVAMTYEGRKRFQFKDIMPLGGRDKILARLEKHALPQAPIMVCLATAILVGLMGWHLLYKPSYLLLFGGVAILTSARLLFGYAAAVAPPNSAEALALALYLLPVAPAVIISVHRSVHVWDLKWRGWPRTHRGKFWMAAAEGVAPLVTAGMVGLPSLWLYSPGHALPAFAPLGAIIALYLLLLFVIPRSQTTNRFVHDPVFWTNGYLVLYVALVLVTALRIVLLMGGYKEQVPFVGSRLPLSLFHIPVFTALLALAAGTYLREKRLEVRLWAEMRFAGFVYAAIAGHVLTAVLVSDLGMVLYMFPAAFFLAGLGLPEFRGTFRLFKGTRQWDRLGPIAMALPALLIALAMLASFYWIHFPSEHKAPGARGGVANAPLVADYNRLRLLQWTHPARVQYMGTRSAEGISQDIAIMNDYASRGLLGEGFLKVPVNRAVWSTCLNDKVGSIYLLAQFGYLGGATVALAYLALLGVGLRHSKDEAAQGSLELKFGAQLAGMAALMVVAPSLYMLGANCGVFPFTGRNMYFLGLNSLGDIFESLTLLGMITWGAGLGEHHTGNLS